MDLSLDEGSEEVLDDSIDELVVKMRVSNSDEAFDDEHKVKDLGTHLQTLLYLLFLHFWLFLCTFLYLLCMLSLSCNYRYS